MALAIVPKQDALAAVAMRHEQVERAIAIEIRRDDGGSRFGRQWLASREMPFADR